MARRRTNEDVFNERQEQLRRDHEEQQQAALERARRANARTIRAAHATFGPPPPRTPAVRTQTANPVTPSTARTHPATPITASPSKPTPTTATPITPITQPPPPTHPISIAMTQRYRITPLRGDGSSDENPRQWFREVTNSFDAVTPPVTDDAAKIKIFGANLEADGTADQWFEELDAKSKDTWVNLEASFNLRYPKPTRLVRTAADRAAEILNMSMADDDVGSIVEVNGRKVPGHIAWADKIAPFLAAVKDENGLIVVGLRNTMPDFFRRLLPAKSADPADFLKAVREVDLQTLADAIQDRDEKEAFREALYARPSRATSPLDGSGFSPLRRQLGGLTFSSPSVTTRPTQLRPTAPPPVAALTPMPTPIKPQGQVTPLAASLFSTPSPMKPGNLFYSYKNSPGSPQTPRYPIRTPVERHRVLIANLLPHHPDTAQGWASYQAQVKEWDALWSGRRPNEDRPYPVTPGTKPVGSGECFACGDTPTVFHKATECPNKPLPEHERTWRAIAASIIRSSSSEAPSTPVALVSATEGLYQDTKTGDYWRVERDGNGTPVMVPCTIEVESGKGPGSSR